jgi:hypothetical protein
VATIYTPPGGYVVNLGTAQAGNVVTTNVAQRRILNDVATRAAVLRIIAATGTACTYLVEGSADGAVFWPVPSGDMATAGAFSLVAGAITIAAPATLWRLIPVDTPWSFLRVTYSANTAMVNTADVWAY